ncbi:MAG: Rossmann-like domain-containing protein, partial [cyanobacterium endosymbiont of Rhopalodia yunnanensis]
ASEYLLPESDWVFLTGTSIPNKTFPRLVELSRDAKLVLMGPTVPWLAELAEFGIDYLAGVTVVDPNALRQTVAEGGGVRIFETGVQYQLYDFS